jgi:hypothetical protein
MTFHNPAFRDEDELLRIVCVLELDSKKLRFESGVDDVAAASLSYRD